MKGVGKRRSLEEILLERGTLTVEQLQEALARQREGGGHLGRILQEMGLVSEEEFLEVMSLHLGIPSLSLSDPELPLHRATDAFPLKFMQQYRFFPLKFEKGILTVVMSDPTDVETIDSIRFRLGCEVKVYLGSEREILKALEKYYGASSSMERIIRDLEDEGVSAEEGEEDVAHLKDLASEAPVIRLVNLLIAKAVEGRASDIHIEPFEGRLRVRYRIDGVLMDAESPPKRLQAAVISRIKLMARMNIAERRLPQDGRIRIEVGGKDLDIRVSTVPTIYGESVVMRLLDRASVLLDLSELGFPQEAEQQFEALIRKPHGILLVTGPTGSGKTTTLYAALRALNSVEKKIITIEDPVEYQLEGVNQIQVKPKIGLTFASGLRHIVRQDPDVILVGEIRDRETAEIAIHAALTGHLVLSTLHTNDAAGAITRLLDMGIEDYLVSSTLIGVLAQRLVRRICSNCKAPYVPEEGAFQPSTPNAQHPALGMKGLRLFKGQGCPECHFTGYFGRMGIFELLVMEEGLQRLILEKADANAIREKAVALGMKTLWQDGWAKVMAGMTTLEEVLRVTQEG
ncbi:MAG: type II secretion system ATPase GspE [Candidatus Methylomirabilales bacterium]